MLWAAFNRLLVLSAKRRLGTPQNASETARKRSVRCSCGCRKIFTRYRSNQRYFSAACRKRAWQLRRDLAALKLEIRGAVEVKRSNPRRSREGIVTLSALISIW